MTTQRNEFKRNDVLSYNIKEQLLYGTVGGQSFSMRAFSGGGRGSTSGMAQSDPAHWDTQKKAPGRFNARSRGGPLPAGWYVVHHLKAHKKYGECAFLQQTLLSLVYQDKKTGDIKLTERSDFMIHKRGPHGSDGCIVPETQQSLHSLLGALRSVKHPIILEVFQD